MNDIRKQYNTVADAFSTNHQICKNSNDLNRVEFYSLLDFLEPGQKLLDLCCGDGLDANNYQKKGCLVAGIDASEDLINLAQQAYPEINFRVGFAEELPYTDKTFDVVTSKYAIMTSHDMNPIFNEVYRVLKPGGYFAYLMTHPFRQYFEKRSAVADYFKQEVVECNILNNSVKIYEPSHTFNEYFNKDFFSKFSLVNFKESYDPAAEDVDGRTYPGYFIVVCQKK